MYNAYMHIHMFPICLMFICIIMCIYIYISLSVFSLFKEYNMYRYICITIYIYIHYIHIVCLGAAYENGSISNCSKDACPKHKSNDDGPTAPE